MVNDTINEKKEVTFLSIFVMLLKWKKVFVKKRVTILACGFTLAVLGIVYAWLTPRTYTAELTFAIDSKTSGASSYAAVASQFGINLGSGGEAGLFQGDNLNALMNSSVIMKKTLTSSSVFDAQPQLLIYRYLEKNGVDIDTMQYNYNKPIESYTRSEDSLLLQVIDGIREENFTCKGADSKSAFFTLAFKGKDEAFCKAFLETITEVASKFYLDYKTEKVRKGISVIQFRIDSVREVLRSEMFGAASEQDHNMNAALAKIKIPYQQKQLNVQLLTVLYGELTKNAEVLKMSLVKEEPIIQIVDKPILPLKYIVKGKKVYGVLGFLVGSILASLYFVSIVLIKSVKIPSSIKDEIENVI